MRIHVCNLLEKLGAHDRTHALIIALHRGLIHTNAALDAGIRGQTTWQLVDFVTWVLGPHTLKIGMDARVQHANNFQPSTLSGSYTFAGFIAKFG